MKALVSAKANMSAGRKKYFFAPTAFHISPLWGEKNRQRFQPEKKMHQLNVWCITIINTVVLFCPVLYGPGTTPFFGKSLRLIPSSETKNSPSGRVHKAMKRGKQTHFKRRGRVLFVGLSVHLVGKRRR